MARGWPLIVLLERPVRYWLQWGRGGWPADAAERAAAIAKRHMLQWGRGGWPADDETERVQGQPTTGASMGPRGLARG